MKSSIAQVLRLGAIMAIGSMATACTLTLPVQGELQSPHESFVGHATGHMDAAGELELTMASGAKCGGRFVYVTPRQGSGTLTCSDGRSGKFDFVSTGKRGTGSGTLNGVPFTLTFG